MKKENKLSAALSILITIFPILDVYELNFAPISFGEVTLIVYIIYFFFTHKRIGSYKYCRIYYVYLIYALLFSFIMGAAYGQIEFSDHFFKWARIILYSIILIVLGHKYIDNDIVYKCLKIICIILSITEIFQCVLWYIFRIPLYFKIPFFKLHYTISNYSNYVSAQMIYNGTQFRPSNFFLEPSHFAEYGSFALAYFLFYKKENNIGIAFLLSIAITLSKSATGLIMVAILWLLWLIMLIRNRAVSFKKVFYFLIICFAVLILFTTNNQAMQNLVYRIGTIGESGQTTGSMRLLRGLAIFQELPVTMKIFGCGLGTLEQYLIKYSITTIYDTGLQLGNEYMNSFSYILVNTGIFGLAIFICFVIDFAVHMKKKDLFITSIFILWIIDSLSSSTYLTIFFVLPFAIISSENRMDKKNEMCLRGIKL